MRVRAFLAAEGASSAAEFGLVLTPLLALLCGAVDGGRYLWECNQAEKATQVGARVAVVTDLIPGGLGATTFVGKTIGTVTLTQGDVVPADAIGTVSCSKPDGTLACSCDTCDKGLTLTPLVSTGWDKIVERMRLLAPDIQESDIRVEYSGSGLGFAGDPNGPDISPLVTVKIEGVRFKPLSTMAFSTMSIPLPKFQTTLTAEDVAGTQSE